MSNPLISIITVTYNAAEAIERTILSVLKQPREQYEYIVIDGNSTDGTQKLIEQYTDNIDLWISEPDKGIADALNKAVKQAKGKYILSILAGDFLIELPYSLLAAEDSDLVCFPVLVTGDLVQYPEVNDWLKIKNTIPHQGAFFKNTADLLHDLRYRFYCDLALCQLYYKNRRTIKVYDEPVVAFHGLDGATSNKRNFREVFKIVGDNYGWGYKALSFLYFKYDGLLRRLKLN